MAMWDGLGHSTHFFSHNVRTISPGNAWALLLGGYVHTYATLSTGEGVPSVYDYVARSREHEHMSWIRYASSFDRVKIQAQPGTETNEASVTPLADGPQHRSRLQSNPPFRFGPAYPETRRKTTGYRERIVPAVVSVLWAHFPAARSMSEDCAEHKSNREAYSKAVLAIAFPYRTARDLRVNTADASPFYNALQRQYTNLVLQSAEEEVSISSAVPGIGKFREHASVRFPQCEYAYLMLRNIEEEHHALAKDQDPVDLRHLDSVEPLPEEQQQSQPAADDSSPSTDLGGYLDTNPVPFPEIDKRKMVEPITRSIISRAVNSHSTERLPSSTLASALNTHRDQELESKISTLAASPPFFIEVTGTNTGQHYSAPAQTETTVTQLQCTSEVAHVGVMGMQQTHSPPSGPPSTRYKAAFQHSAQYHDRLFALGPRPQIIDVASVFNLNDHQYVAMRALCAHLCVKRVIPDMRQNESITTEHARELAAQLKRYLPNDTHKYTSYSGATIEVLEKSQPLRLFLTGAGGSGKSHVINAIVAWASSWGIANSICLLATTNVAASGINGYTWQSATNKNVTKEMWQHIDLVILDEVSMLGQHDLGILNTRLQKLKNNSDAPFGGLGLCFTGDFSQLPPVLAKTLYFSGTHEESALWYASVNTTVVLEGANERLLQSTTPETKHFARALHLARTGDLDQEAIATLNECVLKPQNQRSNEAALISAQEGASTVILTVTNKEREQLAASIFRQVCKERKRFREHWRERGVLEVVAGVRDARTKDLERVEETRFSRHSTTAGKERKPS